MRKHWLMCSKFKPHMLMVLAQTGATFSYFISQAAFNQGMDPKIYTTYRLIVGALSVFPFAYFIERDQRPKLTAALVGEIFALSLLGTCLPMNLFFASMKCTSPTFVSVVNNTIASLVFILAVLLRMENLNIVSPHGMAKVLGTVLSLAGVMVMTLYKGLEVSTFNNAPFHNANCKVSEGKTVKGSIIAVASCVSLSLSYILQGKTLQRYPAQLSLVVWINMIGGLMSAAFAGLVLDSTKPWVISFDIKLASVLYGGLVGSGFLVFVQLWCTKVKGPVFMTMFNPLTAIMSAFVAYFLVGDTLYMGRIIGGSIVVIGLYSLLWGKHREDNIDQASSTSYTLLASAP